MKFLFFFFPFLKPDFCRYNIMNRPQACIEDEDMCYANIVNIYKKKDDISSKFYGKQIKNRVYDCKICDTDCTFILDNDDVLWRFKNGDMAYYDWDNENWILPHLIKKIYKPKN